MIPRNGIIDPNDLLIWQTEEESGVIYDTPPPQAVARTLAPQNTAVYNNTPRRQSNTRDNTQVCINAMYREGIGTEAASRNEQGLVSARDYAEARGATVHWLRNRSVNGVIYADATLTTRDWYSDDLGRTNTQQDSFARDEMLWNAQEEQVNMAAQLQNSTTTSAETSRQTSIAEFRGLEQESLEDLERIRDWCDDDPSTNIGFRIIDSVVDAFGSANDLVKNIYTVAEFADDLGAFARNIGGANLGSANPYLRGSTLSGAAGAGIKVANKWDARRRDGVSSRRNATDTIVDAAVQLTLFEAAKQGAAAGTKAIPIPGVGTAIGAGIGILGDYILSNWRPFGRTLPEHAQHALNSVAQQYENWGMRIVEQDLHRIRDLNLDWNNLSSDDINALINLLGPG